MARLNHLLEEEEEISNGGGGEEEVKMPKFSRAFVYPFSRGRSSIKLTDPVAVIVNRLVHDQFFSKILTVRGFF